MTTTDIVLITILCMAEAASLVVLFKMMLDMEDGLIIPLGAMVILGLFIYLVAQ